MDLSLESSPATWSCRFLVPTSAQEKILAAATQLFCDEGFAATGVDRIAKEAGTAKSTLYANFGSKEKLIEAVLEREGEAWRAWFFGRLGRVSGTPEDRLSAMFDILEDWFADPDFYGCPFINAIAESSFASELSRQAAQRHKAPLLTWLKAVGIELGLPDVDGFADQIVVLIDGAIIAAQAGRKPAFAQSAKALALSIIQTSRPLAFAD